MELVKVHTSKNPVDALTKVLSRNGFYKCMGLMGLLDKEELVKAMKYQDGDCRIRCNAPKPQTNKKANKKKKPKK